MPSGKRPDRRGGDLPASVAVDTYGSDAVPLLVDGTQHVRSGDAAHVVFGRLAAEEHDEVNPVVGHAPHGSRRRATCTGIRAVARYRDRMRVLASDVAAATGGTLFGPDVMLDGVSFDSRTLEPGQLFVPIVAERDGHDFIAAARARGASAHLTQREPGSGTSVVVADTSRALMQLAAWARTRLAAKVVGITGSVGKTTTKDMARAALGAGLRTWANEKSFNNEQGLPVTILNSPDSTEALVLEMGMRGFGEIARLCDIARPDIGVVTRVAEAHTERVGGIAGVARAKAELVEALPVTGTAVLNADDFRVAAMRSVASCAVVTFGTSETADVYIHDLSLDDLARARFTLRTPWGTSRIELALSGAHMAFNAAAALAVAGLCGVDLEAASAAVAHAPLSPWRMDVGRTPSGAVLINDSYNANPASMHAAITTLASMTVSGRRVAVLGVMAELADPVHDHAEIAALCRAHEIELVAVGTDLYGAPQRDDALSVLRSLTAADAVLVKGSRIAGLERLVELIVGE